MRPETRSCNSPHSDTRRYIAWPLRATDAALLIGFYNFQSLRMDARIERAEAARKQSADSTRKAADRLRRLREQQLAEQD